MATSIAYTRNPWTEYISKDSRKETGTRARSESRGKKREMDRFRAPIAKIQRYNGPRGTRHVHVLRSPLSKEPSQWPKGRLRTAKGTLRPIYSCLSKLQSDAEKLATEPESHRKTRCSEGCGASSTSRSQSSTAFLVSFWYLFVSFCIFLKHVTACVEDESRRLWTSLRARRHKRIRFRRLASISLETLDSRYEYETRLAPWEAGPCGEKKLRSGEASFGRFFFRSHAAPSAHENVGEGPHLLRERDLPLESFRCERGLTDFQTHRVKALDIVPSRDSSPFVPLEIHTLKIVGGRWGETSVSSITLRKVDLVMRDKKQHVKIRKKPNKNDKDAKIRKIQKKPRTPVAR